MNGHGGSGVGVRLAVELASYLSPKASSARCSSCFVTDQGSGSAKLSLNLVAILVKVG